MVHKWRSEESTIMVGTETALKDNPKLNVRAWTGKSPLRVVMDQHLRLPDNLHLFDGSIPTIVYTSKSKENQLNLEFVEIDFKENILESILEDLFVRSVQSLIVEGGQKLLNSFIRQELWDEARVFTGPMKFGLGVKAPVFPYTPRKILKTGNSGLEIYRKETNDD